MRGNIIRGNIAGIRLASGGLPGALIENNLIAGNASFGIENDRTPQVVIRNNTIVANGLAGYREQFGPPVSISFVNNIVAFNGTHLHPAQARSQSIRCSPTRQTATFAWPLNLKR